MNILILNPILFTVEKSQVFPKVKSIKDTMIYGMGLGFKKLGHNVTLAAAEEYKPTEKEQYDFHVLFFRSNLVQLAKPSMFPISFEFWKYLKENEDIYDLVITSEVFSFYSLVAAIICPRKTVIWQELNVHQHFMNQIPSKVWYNIIAKIFMQKVIAVIPRSLPAYNFIKHYMPRISHTIVDHGINIDKFISSINKEKQIISSSQLIYRKNVDGIIKKFADFHKMKGYAEIKLLIVGRGNMETELKKLVEELHLENYVIFLGFLSQKKLSYYISHSMAFVINTRKDLNMVSIPESIVSGTPVLTNRKPASIEYIEKYKLGIVKDDWGIQELKTMIDNNSIFVKRCLNYRNCLSNVHQAQIIIDIFEESKISLS